MSCKCVLTLQKCATSIFTVTDLGSYITDSFPLPKHFKHPPDQNSVTQKMETACSLNHWQQLMNLHNDQHISNSHYKTLETYNHHHVQEGLGLIPVPCTLKMKLVPPSLPRSSYVSSSFWFIL